jgi:hypothetical protein
MTVMNKIDDVVKKDLAGGQGDRDENEIEKPEMTRLIAEWGRRGPFRDPGRVCDRGLPVP